MVNGLQNDQRVAKQGSCLISAHGIQQSTVPFILKSIFLSCGRREEQVMRVRRQMAARGSLASASSWHLLRKAGSMGNGRPVFNWKATFLRKVEQLGQSQPQQRSSRTGYFSEYRFANSAMTWPTANASGPLYASKMARTRFKCSSKPSCRQLLQTAFSRKSTPASLTSLPMNARKNGSNRPILPQILNPPGGGASEYIACAVFLKYSASSLVSKEILSSRMMLNSFFFSSASCSRAEVNCARVFRPTLSGVEGTFPLRQIHCPRNRGSSSAAMPSTFISSSNSASGEEKVRSTRSTCSFLLQQVAPSTNSTIQPCQFSRAACTTSSEESSSRRSLRMNLRAVSSSSLVSHSMRVCKRAQCSCPTSASAPCDFTMWSIKLGFVNNVISDGYSTTTIILPHLKIASSSWRGLPSGGKVDPYGLCLCDVQMVR